MCLLPGLHTGSADGGSIGSAQGSGFVPSRARWTHPADFYPMENTSAAHRRRSDASSDDAQVRGNIAMGLMLGHVSGID
jgi:hypothetical protein